MRLRKRLIGEPSDFEQQRRSTTIDQRPSDRGDGCGGHGWGDAERDDYGCEFANDWVECQRAGGLEVRDEADAVSPAVACVGCC
jgi:hypothetical protein